MKIKLTYLFTLFTLTAFAQEFCGTIMPNSPDPNFDVPFEMLNDNSLPGPSSEDKFVLKVHFWDFTLDDGTNLSTATLTEQLDVVAGLNKEFNQFNIFFKYDGIDEVATSEWDNIDVPWSNNLKEELVSFLIEEEAYLSGYLNIYMPHFTGSLGGVAFWDDNAGSTKFAGVLIQSIIQGNYLYHELWAHEVGHFLGLRHTFTTAPGKENVAREGEPNFNAEDKGDKLVDTFATPQWYDIDNCIYVGDQIDDVGRPYSDYPPQADNFMSYYWDCMNNYTQDQVTAMRNFLDHFSAHPDGILYITNYPVSILYEPFEGEYYESGPIMAKDHPLFQPGFDYKFVDVSQAEVWNQPSPYEYTNFWTGSSGFTYSSDNTDPVEHLNHYAFYISQLGDDTYRMCYNNYNRAPKDGDVIHFIDGVPNGNYTITHQDSTAINSPTLIDDLSPGLYNIQRNYPDGSTQQSMIQKENN